MNLYAFINHLQIGELLSILLFVVESIFTTSTQEILLRDIFRNPEVNASEFPEKHEKMLLWYYMHMIYVTSNI